MFDRVVMNIIYVMVKIAFGTNAMFPESALPYRLFAFALTAAKHGGTLGGFVCWVNERLMFRHRIEYSASSGGNVHNA